MIVKTWNKYGPCFCNLTRLGLIFNSLLYLSFLSLLKKKKFYQETSERISPFKWCFFFFFNFANDISLFKLDSNNKDRSPWILSSNFLHRGCASNQSLVSVITCTKGRRIEKEEVEPTKYLNWLFTAFPAVSWFYHSLRILLRECYTRGYVGESFKWNFIYSRQCVAGNSTYIDISHFF